MPGGGDDAFDAGKFFRHKRGDALQAWSADEYEQVVTAGHEITRFDFIEPADAFGEAIESATAFGGDADFDDGAHDTRVFVGEVEHRAPAQEHTFAFELLQVTVDFAFGQVQDLRHLCGAEVAAFEQKFKDRIHGRQ